MILVEVFLSKAPDPVCFHDPDPQHCNKYLLCESGPERGIAHGNVDVGVVGGRLRLDTLVQ